MQPTDQEHELAAVMPDEMSIHDLRVNVAARIIPDDSTIRPDILDPSATHDNLIRLLDLQTAPIAKGGHATMIEVTALHRDHHDDGDLGPHGHNPHGAPGWACDFVLRMDPWLKNHAGVKSVVLQLITANKYCTKVGGPAWMLDDHDVMQAAQDHNVTVFADPGTGPHLHVQSA